ncbi:hypothetical protein OUZ56_008945 [Daphnia magna]|uniref:Uncharacterized protein n=1 Tax=Daphnia magna TaxID=35525 RepID=A0ABR0AEI6_9CRUS|nr:hypothetical protein OUZ56_008945 [Daphnia magna]
MYGIRDISWAKSQTAVYSFNSQLCVGIFISSMFNDIFRGGGHHGVGTWFELTVVRVNRDDGCMQRSVSGWSLLNAAENKVSRRKGRAADIVALLSDGSGYESRRDREQEFKSSTSGRRK